MWNVVLLECGSIRTPCDGCVFASFQSFRARAAPEYVQVDGSARGGRLPNADKGCRAGDVGNRAAVHTRAPVTGARSGPLAQLIGGPVGATRLLGDASTMSVPGSPVANMGRVE